MSYPEKQLSGYVLLADAQGTTNDDVAAPDEGQTLLYTTEQGLVLERDPGVGFAARQWFLDQPALLVGAGTVSLTDTAQSVLDAPYTIPDDIDANFPTLYRVEVQVAISSFAPDVSSAGVWLYVYSDGSPYGPPTLVPCDAVTGDGGGTFAFFVAGFDGDEIDVRARLINAADAADCYLYFGVVRRDLRVVNLP